MIKFDILDIQNFFFHHSDKFLNIFVIFFVLMEPILQDYLRE